MKEGRRRKEMKTKLSLLFLAGGFFFITLAGSKLYSTTKVQKETLLMATEHVASKEPLRKIDRTVQVEKNDILGVLNLPTIGSTLPIVAGVSDDDLEKGVGHYTGTALPDQNDQVVLSGHRDTVFKRLGELKIGDEIIVQMNYGAFTYVVEETFIVAADDRTVIKSTAPIEVLTITTCYPFNFVGNAPERYIVNAKRKE
jgi:sortase A